MARFAKIGLNSKVIDIIELDDTLCTDADDNFDENLGIQWCTQRLYWSIWKACTDARFGDKNAGVGATYDEDNDVFIGIKPFNSWTFNISTGDWDPPVSRPADMYGYGGDVKYIWNETDQQWDAV